MLKKHLLSCKDVAHVASNYLDDNTSGKLTWKIRAHLLACACCRRFIRHLKITQQVSSHIIRNTTPDVNTEAVLRKIKETSLQKNEKDKDH